MSFGFGPSGGVPAFKADGTGAVSRPIADKLSDVVSVKDFGAVGDGVTDDAPAFAAFFEECVSSNRRGVVPAGTYFWDTDFSVDLDDGETLAVDWLGATVKSDGSDGICTIKSDPVASLDLAGKIAIGSKVVPVTSAAGVQYGDVCVVDPRIAYDTGSQNVARMIGMVVAIDTTSTPNTLTLSHPSYYTIKPNREIETVWDGVTSSYDYRWWFGTQGDVQLLVDDVDQTDDLTFVSVGSYGLRFTISPVPSNEAVVKWRSTSNAPVSIYRSGKLIFDGFRWKIDRTETSTAQRKAIIMSGLRFPEFRNIRLETTDQSRTSGFIDDFEGPQYFSGSFATFGVRGSNIKVIGGGYSLRWDAVDVEIRGVDCRSAYKALDPIGAENDHRYYDFSVYDAFMPFGNHAGKKIHIENLIAHNVRSMWNNRGHGLTVKNAKVEIVTDLALEDFGSGQSYLIDDVLAIDEDSPLRLYSAQATHEALQLRAVIRDVEFLGDNQPTMGFGNLVSVELENVRGLGTLQFEGAGPPLTKTFDAKTIHIGALNPRGVDERLKIENSSIASISNIDRIPEGKTWTIETSSITQTGAEDPAISIAKSPISTFTGRLLLRENTFSGGGLPWKFTHSRAQTGVSLVAERNEIVGYSGLTRLDRRRLYPLSAAADSDTRKQSRIGDNYAPDAGLLSCGRNAAFGVYAAEPEEGFWSVGDRVYLTGAATLFRCTVAGWAMAASEERQTETAYSVDDWVWHEDGSAVQRVYMCKTAGTTSANAVESALLSSVNVDYTDGTVVWVYMGQRAVFV